MWGADVLDVEVPAGALRAGPATAMVVGVSTSTVHRVRFMVVDGQPARLRLLASPEALVRGPPAYFRVRAVSDSEGSWESKVDADRAMEGRHAQEALFVGTAGQLASLQQSVERLRGVTSAARATFSSVQIQPSLPSDCRSLAFWRLVIASGPAAESVAKLEECAPRGATVLVVAARPTRPDIPSGRVVPLGLGEIAFAEPGGDSAAVLAIELADRSHRQSLDQALAMMSREQLKTRMDVRRPVPLRDVLALLGAYVVLIGPAGYWVARRSRRTWLAWAWFPLAAIGTSAALLLYARAAATRPAKILEREVSLTDPSGSGLRHTSLVIEGASRASYSLRMPWQEADLGFIAPEHRFGSPFADPIGALVLEEDTIAHTAWLANIAVARLSSVPLSWMAPTTVARLPTLEIEGSTVYVRNPLPDTLSIGRLVVAGRLGRFSGVQGRDRGAVDFADRPGVREIERRLEDWPAWNWEQMAPANGYLLIAEYAGLGSHEVHVEPATPVTSTTLRLVAGPVPAPLAAALGSAR